MPQKKQAKNTAKAKERCVIVFCAHNDDQIIGVGGTIKKYAQEGIKTYTYVFSYGESSHPHMKPDAIAKERAKESFRSAKILGEDIEYFGLRESQFEEEAELTEIQKIVLEKNPEKIFTHAPDDPHPDHRATYRIVTRALKGIDFKEDVYAFDIWNYISTQTRMYPKLYIDISKTYRYKVKAFKAHKTQIGSILLLGWHMWLKAILNGWHNHSKYAEVFHKIDLDSVTNNAHSRRDR